MTILQQNVQHRVHVPVTVFLCAGRPYEGVKFHTLYNHPQAGLCLQWAVVFTTVYHYEKVNATSVHS